MLLPFKRFRRIFIALPLVLLSLFIGAGLALAHANLLRSDPGEGSVVAEAPARIQLWYSENLEKGFSSASVVDTDGKQVSNNDSSVSESDPKSMSVGVPKLSNGIYTVIWQALSAEDGHVTKGAFAFAVGDPATTAAPVGISGALPRQTSDAPNALAIVGRWLSFLGPTGILGSVLFQMLILGPLFRKAKSSSKYRGRYLRLVWITGLAVLLSVPLSVMSQAMSVSGKSLIEALQPSVLGPLFATRYANLLLVRLGLSVLLFPFIFWMTKEEEIGARKASIPANAIVILSVGILLTISLNSHASAVGEWAWIAVGADVLHLIAVAAWIGGVFQFVIALGPFLESYQPGQRGAALGRLIPEFSKLALVSVATLIVTGGYAMWLHFPTLESVASTDYGRALLIKLAIFTVILILGALNLFITTPALAPYSGRAAKQSQDVARKIADRFRIQISTEAGLGLAILLVVAVMVLLPPAASVVGGTYADTQSVANLKVNLKVTPNDVGPNRYTVEVNDPSGKPIADIQRVVIRFQMLDHEMGQQETPLQPGPAGIWYGDGSHLSMVGNWGMRVIVRTSSGEDVELKFSERLGAPTSSSGRGPFPLPADFGVSNAVLLPGGMIFVGAVIAILAMRSYRRDPKMAPLFLTSGLAIAFFGLYVVVFQTPKAAQATIPINPVPPTADSVERGRLLYVESCTGCHGKTGKGDGPLARALNPKPADLSQHVEFHPEGQLYIWITKGVPGTAMPNWESQFTPDEVWDLVNYLRGTFAATDR